MRKARKNKKKIIKKGFTSNGKQMYMDTETGIRYIADEDRAVLGFAKQDKDRALEMYSEGLGIRSIARIIHCCPATIINWIRAAAAKLPPLAATLLAESKVGVAELDEMWHFF